MGLDLVRLQQNVILLTCDIKKLYNYIYRHSMKQTVKFEIQPAQKTS